MKPVSLRVHHSPVSRQTDTVVFMNVLYNTTEIVNSRLRLKEVVKNEVRRRNI